MTEPILTEPILYESHSHTPLCKHATGDPAEYAAVAQQRGLKGLIVTCHNPMPDGFSAAVRMREDQFDQYVDLVQSARDQWQERVDVRLGLEADYFEGHEASWSGNWLRPTFTLCSARSIRRSVSSGTLLGDDPSEVQRTYFRLLAKSAETGLFDRWRTRT